MQLLNRPSVAGIHYWCTPNRFRSPLKCTIDELNLIASTAFKTQGDYFNSWSFLLSSGGSDGLANRGGENRPLLIPVNDQSTFKPQGTSDFAAKAIVNNLAKAKHSKRDRFIEEEPEAVHIWDEGCRTANEFAAHGSK